MTAPFKPGDKVRVSLEDAVVHNTYATGILSVFVDGVEHRIMTGCSGVTVRPAGLDSERLADEKAARLAAANILRAPLARHWQTPPFTVKTRSGQLDGIAWCNQHTDVPGWEHTACDWCEVIDTPDPTLAALLVALFRSREPLGNLLAVETHALGTGHALTVARTVNEVTP